MSLSPSRIDVIFKEHMGAVAASMQMSPHIVLAAAAMVDCLRRGGKVLACGNGGSAADAQHFACELVGRFLSQSKPFAALALTTDPSTMTAVGNDYGFEHSFSRQVLALGREGDVLLAISTSGSSANVVNAALAAKSQKLMVIAMTGKDGGELKGIAEVCLVVPSLSTPRIQEIHELIIHAICEIVEEELA